MRDGLDLTMFFVGIAVGICAVKLWYKCFKDERINMNDNERAGSWLKRDEHVADVVRVRACSYNKSEFQAVCRCGKWKGSASTIEGLQEFFDKHKFGDILDSYPRELR